MSCNCLRDIPISMNLAGLGDSSVSVSVSQPAQPVFPLPSALQTAVNQTFTYDTAPADIRGVYAPAPAQAAGAAAAAVAPGAGLAVLLAIAGFLLK